MPRTVSLCRLAFSVFCALALAASASAQSTDDDGALDLAEPDFTLVNLPTTLRLPVGKSDFHLTHRFGGNLRVGSFGDQAGDLFGLDRGAIVGLEFRYGVLPHLQAIVHRSSFDKTIQFSAKYDAIHQSDGVPVSISGLLSAEAPNNFRRRSNGFTESREVAPALGAVVSREILDRGAVYVTPIWVHNSAAASSFDTRDTFFVGIGGRARIASTVYIVGEVSPRAAGFVSGQAAYGFGIEKRAGGHMFQLTFANLQGTTFGLLARGGSPQTLYLGFNLTRKFF